MNKIIISLVVYLTLFTVSAQENVDKKNINKNKLPYNTWSIEANIGSNKAVRPFTTGYATSGDNKFLNITGINHFDLGVRKMLNTYFGFKFDFASDVVESQDRNTDSKPFQSFQNRIALQGFANIGRILKFESFTKRFGLLAHGGVQISKLNGKTENGKSLTENNGGYMLGLSPQFKITNKLVANFDFTVLVNSRQHLDWDGNYSSDETNLSGEMNVLSFGLTYYFGEKKENDSENKKEHADWYVAKTEQDVAVKNSLAELELLKKDTDKDGVTDNLDLQENTPPNVAVDSRGRYIDTNANNIPDELEPKIQTSGEDSFLLRNTKEIILEFGIVDIYYDIDKTIPVVRSVGVLNNLILFLQKYPETKIVLTGFADVTGNPEANVVLAKQRAEDLKKIIVSRGIDENRMFTSGKGVDQDSKANDDPSLQLARRVSVTLQ